jgi:flagellar hook protein FlgE
MGTLADFAVEGDGRISGTFTNGLLRTIGQVVISTFTNPGGLVDLGNLQYSEGPNSGESLITTPLSAGSGRVVSGSLELSNVDLSQEFINLILASTGYTASSRVINTANTLFQQLLVLGR